ncbi:MAG: hypothetical protein J5841_04565 [Clostridia bacterium]|nr:hypothetical protein [Clostridia bacterium]
MKTPVTSRSLRQHFTYNWWMYLLIALIALGLVDLLYAVTAYRAPREKTVGFYVYGYMNDTSLTAYLDNVRETEMSDMEEITPVMLTVDDAYGPMQLLTYLSAGEGDVYLLPREQFLNYAMGGTMAALEDDEELMSLFNAAGINLQSGWRKETETGENHLYGIPQDKLPGLSQYAYVQDGFLCVPLSGGNQENAMKFLRILCRDMISVPETEEETAP